MLGQEIFIICINAAGITSKIDSFDMVQYYIQPSIFMLQETKQKSSCAKMKAKNLDNFQVFELRREKSKKEGGKGLSGGGLAVGALHDLKPVFIRQGNNDMECITI